jgi:hypothetical protein
VHRGLSWRALSVHTGCKSAANPPKPKDLSQINPVSPIFGEQNVANRTTPLVWLLSGCPMTNRP